MVPFLMGVLSLSYICSMHFYPSRTDLLLFELLRVALDNEGRLTKLSVVPNDEGWNRVYALAKSQCVRGVVYSAIKKLPEEYHPPKSLNLRWGADAEMIASANRMINQESARLTNVFETAGFKTAILKGAANARLYPNPFSRHVGDIDIWVEGGRDRIYSLLVDLNFLSEKPVENTAPHHVHLPKNKDGITVEVHFKPAQGIPFRNRHLQAYLNQEIRNAQRVPEGFYAPSIQFALVMQLSHLQQHALAGGLGLRQYTDYLMLLIHSTEIEREKVFSLVKSLHLKNVCGAVMWVLQEVFGLERKWMLCAPDRSRGERLLKMALEGGNFGKHKTVSKPRNVFVRWFKDRMRTLSWIPFDPLQVFFMELRYWRSTISLIPLRIKRRRIAL